MEYTQNMFEVGDWVHTENGIGQITNVLPIYYQYWEKEHDEAGRLSTWGEGQEVANRVFGKVPDVGEWMKDMVTMKRLCDHDLNLLSRTSCFTRTAYANDKVTKREMAEVKRLLKDEKVRMKFEKYSCKYEQIRHLWRVYISPEKAVKVKRAFDDMEGNSSESLRMTMREIESYFMDSFNIDILHGTDKCKYNNATIHTLTMPENSSVYYNSNKEQLFCKILISKQWYEREHISQVIKAQKLDPSYYDNDAWSKYGWDGEEIQR